MVEALCYKPEKRGFESRWLHWILSNLTNTGGRARSALKIVNLTVIWAEWLNNVGSSTSHFPVDLQGLLHGYIFFYLNEHFRINLILCFKIMSSGFCHRVGLSEEVNISVESTASILRTEMSSFWNRVRFQNVSREVVMKHEVTG
jgi:hypothetical protein